MKKPGDSSSARLLRVPVATVSGQAAAGSGAEATTQSLDGLEQFGLADAGALDHFRRGLGHEGLVAEARSGRLEEALRVGELLLEPGTLGGATGPGVGVPQRGADDRLQVAGDDGQVTLGEIRQPVSTALQVQRPGAGEPL